MPVLEKFDRFNHRISFWVEWIGLTGLLLMMFITCIDVIGAKMFKTPVPGALDIVMISQLLAVACAVAASLILASGTTSPRVGGVGECTIHVLDDECDIEDLCQKMEEMAEIKKSWEFFRRDAAMLRDADAVLITTSLRSLTDPADINYRLAKLFQDQDPDTAKRYVLEALADAPRFRQAHRLLLKIISDTRSDSSDSESTPNNQDELSVTQEDAP